MNKTFAVDISNRTTSNAQSTQPTVSNNNKTPMPFINQNGSFNANWNSKSPGKNKKNQVKRGENESINNQKGDSLTVKFTKAKNEPSRQSDNRRNPLIRKLLFYLKQSQLFKFFLLLLLTIFTNSLYFNFYYLPTHLEYERYSENKQNQAKPSLPHLSWSSDWKNPNLMRIESYDHVAFPSFDNKRANELVDSQHPSSLPPSTSSNELKETNVERPLESFLNKESLNEQEKRTESRMALSLAKKMIHE